MPDKNTRPTRSLGGLPLRALALAVTLAFAAPISASETTAVMNKILKGSGISTSETAILLESIASGNASERIPAAHHELFAKQLRLYGLNDEARLFLAGGNNAGAQSGPGNDTFGNGGAPSSAAPAAVSNQGQSSTNGAVTETGSTNQTQASVARQADAPASTRSGQSSAPSNANGAALDAATQATLLPNDSPVPDLTPRVEPDERALTVVVNRIMRGESLTTDQREVLHRALGDDTLNRLIPVDRHDDFTDQLARYDMAEEAAMFKAGQSSQGDLLARLPGTPRPVYQNDYSEEYIEGVQYFTNELGQSMERRDGAQLIIVDFDNRIMRIDDPLAGDTLERVGSSCLLNSGRTPGRGTPPQTYGTDMIVFDSPVSGRVRIEERTKDGYETWYQNYSVQRYALSWSDQSGSTLPSYFFGGRIRPVFDDEGNKIGTETDPFTWHRYACNVRSINF